MITWKQAAVMFVAFMACIIVGFMLGYLFGVAR
jgi:hypothetical protein